MPEETPDIVRDVDFFFDPIFIRVENTIFKIPKHYVAQISIFATTLSLPPGEDGIEGLAEENPLILYQISKGEFKAFLRVLAPLQSPPSYSKINFGMWKSILKLSTMWEVTDIRELAIKYLSKLVAYEVDKILLGIEFRVTQWFITGCSKLITRSCGPTAEETNQLGIDFVVKIYGLRERMLSGSELSRIHKMQKGSGAYQSHYEEHLAQLVRKTFPDKIFDNLKPEIEVIST